MEKLTIGTRTLPAVTASDAKNEFGVVLDKALAVGAVAITKHDTPKAVLVSLEEYERLIGRTALDTLTAEFDEMLGRMQTQKSRDAVTDMLRMKPAALGRASVEATRRNATRGKKKRG